MFDEVILIYDVLHFSDKLDIG